MGNRLYIGNLSFSATAEEVRGAFEPHGAVTDVRLVMDRATGRSRGFAFVTMGTDEEAARAIQKMDGVMLGGRPLRVNEAQDRVPRPSGFGGGNGGFRALPPEPFGGPGFDPGFGDNRRSKGSGNRDRRGGGGGGGERRERRERW
jgi:RNA recognition motif-containing protein